MTLTSPGATATADVARSPYSIVATAASGSGLDNYTITYDNGSFSVDPALLSITADNQSKTYGEIFAFAGTEFTASTLYNGDTVSAVTLTSAGTRATSTVTASPYSVIPSNASGSGLGNYAITYIPGSFTVNPAALSITADDETKVYGKTLVFVGSEFTTSSLDNGDKVTSVTFASPGAAASATVAGAPYPIIPKTPWAADWETIRSHTQTAH